MYPANVLFSENFVENSAIDDTHKNNLDVTKPVWNIFEEQTQTWTSFLKVTQYQISFWTMYCMTCFWSKNIILTYAILKITLQIEWTELEVYHDKFLCSVETLKSNTKDVVRKVFFSYGVLCQNQEYIRFYFFALYKFLLSWMKVNFLFLYKIRDSFPHRILLVLLKKNNKPSRLSIYVIIGK